MSCKSASFGSAESVLASLRGIHWQVDSLQCKDASFHLFSVGDLPCILVAL